MQSLKFALCALLVLCLTVSFTKAQFSNMYNGAYGYQGGAGNNYGVAGGNYNSYGQNTNAYSNQVASTNYQPYAAYGSAYRGPTAYSSNYGSAYSMPFFGGWGGFGMPFYGFGYGGLWGRGFWC
ncbi:hypothetical protein C9374_009743 [Naegleria lovaniensis]|uniref:Uncharacterized protein n=1 Tax=Naegleria lovaniensis TaxID=51637 RepID=A0AA88H3F6_NAELO|nr:uncharacterized protein C9374_009743 [Naegleria lovaniensis]KAG2393166.1 hypothetical protein C9374_009743 [Naegleria lovaniensis]